MNEVLTYLAALKGMLPKRSAPAIRWWLKRFDLSAIHNRRIDQLSKGMAQKVQFIAAVIHDPEIVFFDEPFAGIDPISSDVLRAALVELVEAGKTVFLSTHMMEHAERICHRIHIIDRGKTVLDGRLSELKERFGTRAIQLETDGNANYLRDDPAVAKLTSYPNYHEIELADGAAPDQILERLLGRVRVRRFEVVSPSLHRIFVEQLTQ